MKYSLTLVISDLPNLLVSYKVISENKKQLTFSCFMMLVEIYIKCCNS